MKQDLLIKRRRLINHWLFLSSLICGIYGLANIYVDIFLSFFLFGVGGLFFAHYITNIIIVRKNNTDFRNNFLDLNEVTTTKEQYLKDMSKPVIVNINGTTIESINGYKVLIIEKLHCKNDDSY